MRAMVLLLLCSVAHAAPRLLALDDAYDCAFAADGTVVAGTAGGLRIGTRVVTALDGLPETRVDHVAIDHDTITATTRNGTARVDVTTGVVTHVVRRAIAPELPTSFDVYGRGIVRKRAAWGGAECIATSDGLYVSRQGRTDRVEAVSLPTGDVSALAKAPSALFVGTFDRGLYRMLGARIERVFDPSVSPHINALAYDDTTKLLWVATARGLSRCEVGEDVRCRRVGDRFAKHTLLLLDHGRIAAGGDEALQFLGENGEVEGEATRKAGARFRSVWALAHDAHGTIYAGTTSGIFYGTEHAFTSAPDTLARVAMARGTIPDDWITALLLDGDRLLAGTYNAGVVALSLETLTQVGASPELGYVNPGGLVRLPDGSVAVCTMSGLHVGAIGAWHEEPTLGRDVTAVVPTGDNAWIGSRRGVALRREHS